MSPPLASGTSKANTLSRHEVNTHVSFTLPLAYEYVAVQYLAMLHSHVCIWDTMVV